MAQRPPKPPRVVEDPAAVLDAMLDRFSWSNILGAVFLGLVVGLVVAWVLIPTYVSGIVASLQGDNPTAYWYICRAAGIVAYGLIWLSIVWGLLLTTNIGKQLGKVAPIVDLHRHISWLSVVFSLTHMLVLLLDTVVPYTLTLVFVPFNADAYRPVAAALGQIGCYLLIFVTVSFWVRSLDWRKSLACDSLPQFRRLRDGHDSCDHGWHRQIGVVLGVCWQCGRSGVFGHVADNRRHK
jgi:predicted ferric reductase